MRVAAPALFSRNLGPSSAYGEISENQALFQLIGTMYGGGGKSTFGLPDLQGRLPIHKGTGGGGSYTLAENGGVERVTLTSSALSTHGHPALATTGLANQGTPGGVVPAQALTVQVYAEDTPLSAFAPAALSTLGGSQPHDNLLPFVVMNFIISLFGISLRASERTESARTS